MSLESTEIITRIKRLRREVLLKEFNQLSDTIIIDYKDIELPAFQNRYKLSFKNLIRILDQKELTNFQMAITNKKNTNSPFIDDFIEMLRSQQNMQFKNKHLNSSEKKDDSFSSNIEADSFSDSFGTETPTELNETESITNEKESPDLSAEINLEKTPDTESEIIDDTVSKIVQPTTENDKITGINKKEENHKTPSFLEKQLPFIAKLIRKFKK